MKVRRGKGGNPAEVPAGTSRVADIGFGDGTRLREIREKEGKVIEGVESPTARRIKLPGKLLRYIGFDEWMRIAKKNAYETIYADLFFHHYFHEKLLGVHARFGETDSMGVREMKQMTLVFAELLKKLAPGGKLEFSITTPKSIKEAGVSAKTMTIEGYRSMLEAAGFVDFQAQDVKKSETKTTDSRLVLDHPDALLLSFTATKPRLKNESILLGTPKKIFVVHENGQAEERTVER